MKRASILIVDNNPIFRQATTKFLQHNHSDEVVIVGTATEGKEALSQAKVLRPQVILVELCMPGLDGVDFIPRLRMILPKARIIALTLLDVSGYRQSALAAGADDFLSKARLVTDLLPAIRRLVPPGAHFDESLGNYVELEGS
ncbi:MAG: response regulator transcription factor [Verrucomicrobiota bacterium]